MHWINPIRLTSVTGTDQCLMFILQIILHSPLDEQCCMFISSNDLNNLIELFCSPGCKSVIC